MILKLSELRVVAFTKFAKESEKTIVTLWTLSTKTYFSQRSQVNSVWDIKTFEVIYGCFQWARSEYWEVQRM